MKNIYIKALIGLAFSLACMILSIRTAEALDTTLRPDATGKIRIDTGMLVDTDDTLSIPAGSTVEFGNFGSVFVRGKLEIGFGEHNVSGTTSDPDLVKGVRIISAREGSPISARGATVLVFNTAFSGSQFITAFNGSAVLISSSTLESSTASPVISVYSSSTLDVSNSILRNKAADGPVEIPMGSALVQVFAQSNATITDSVLESPNTISAILAYNGSGIRLDDSKVSKCSTGITAFNSTKATGIGNSVSCADHEFIAYNDSSVEFAAKKKCCARIVFVPGLQGSRLYRKGLGGIFENQLWEPNRSKDVEKIYLDANGKSILSGIYTKDIIEKTNIAGTTGPLSESIYSGFISYLKKITADHLIDGYSVFPYDWRFAPDEIRVPQLMTEIEKQSALASNGQVIVVSHSYGGFLAKAALYALSADDKKDLVQAAIYAAMPETGAPQAIFGGLHGLKQEILGGLILDIPTAIKLAVNMPSAHFLTPSMHFNAPISLSFFNKKTKSSIAYSPSGISSSTSQTEDQYSLAKIYEWLKQSITKADRDAGQGKVSPVLKNISAAPSSIVSTAVVLGKHAGYVRGAFVEDSIKSFSILGIDIPTPIGMRYEYMPCLPIPKAAILSLNPCSNQSSLDKIVEYSKRGDGIVIFDGKNRRSGKDIILSLADYNIRNKSAIGHANFMESKDVQKAITSIISATSTSGSTDPDANASGSGPAAINPDNPWLNTNTVHVLSVSGFVDGSVMPAASASASTSESAIRIVTTDQNKRLQHAEAATEVLAFTAVSQYDDGWSFAGPLPFERIALRSLEDQTVSISFSEQREIAGSTSSGDGADSIQGIDTVTTESFQGIPVGYGSVMTADMQYITPIPGHMLSIDVDADGQGDMVIASKADNVSGQNSSGSASGSGTPQSSDIPHIPTYDEKKSAALNSMNTVRISASRLEIDALRRTVISTIARSEQYIRKGNPSFAVLLILKKQEWLAGISAQYAKRISVLEKGLGMPNLPGFRTQSERQKKEAEILKIRAYVRDLAKIKVLLSEISQKAIDILAN